MMTRYTENIDILFLISIYCIVLYSGKNRLFRYRAIFASDFSLHCVTGMNDYKCGKLTVS